MTLKLNVMEVTPAREDDHYIEFNDTRGFAADKWRTAVEAQDITPADWDRGRDVDTYEKYGGYVRQAILDSKTAQQRSHLQSLILVARPVYGFVNIFEKLVQPEKVDMSVIWCLLYLNITNAMSQALKLKHLTTWLSNMKRSVEALNQCVENCSDENSARTEATDIFDPLLSLLTGLLRYQRTYITDGIFQRELPQMRDFVKQNIDEIENVVYHFRQIAQHTREQLDIIEKRPTHRGVPFRGDHRNPYDKTEFPVDNLPDILTEKFFGREQIIENVDQHLGNRQNERLRHFLIYGLRGVGKTQIALEYARRFRSKFDAVFWIRCETSASLRQSFSDIAIKLELSSLDQVTRFEENQIKVLEWLKKTSKYWLLIYDNAERERPLNAYWPTEAVGSILLTSRSYYNFEHDERRQGETIPVFTVDERWDLLMELLGPEWRSRHLGGKNGEREREAGNKLMSMLGGLALAISQAATLILETNITRDQSIVSVLEKFEETRDKLPPRLFGSRTETIRSLDAIFALSLNHVSRNARSLLGTFSLLAPDSIPIDLFLVADQSRLDGRLEFCKQNDSYNASFPYDLNAPKGTRGSIYGESQMKVHLDSTYSGSTVKGSLNSIDSSSTVRGGDESTHSDITIRGQKDSANLGTAEKIPQTYDSDTERNIHGIGTIATEMSPRMKEAIQELIRAKLIRQDGRAFVIHRVIQEAFNYRDMDDLQTVFDATTELLHEAFPVQLLGRPLVNVWPRCQMFVQHVVHLTKAFASHLKGNKGHLVAPFNFIQLLSNCGWYLYEVADYVECLDMTNVACSAYDDKRSLLYSHLVNILGGAYIEQNKMKKARECFTEARYLREMHLEADHPQIATALSNLGNVETSDGNLDEAQELFEKAARIKESWGADEVIALGMSFLQLGRVAALRNETFVAINRFDKAEACWIRRPAQSQQFMAFLHYARGNLYLSRPDHVQATPHYEKCRDLCHAQFPVHPVAAAAYYKLALCDMARGRNYHDKALSNLEKAYNIATVRSGGETDGVVARIQWKRAELMIDDPIRRAEGLKIRDALKLDILGLALDLDIQLPQDPDWSDEQQIDMLVPGYFR